MTYLGSRYIDIHTWTTVGTRSAGHRGQRIGHLTKMYNSRLYSALFEQHYIDLIYDIYYSRSKYDLYRKQIN